ncbi:hypothetical protein BJ138DRAFT_1078212 [Hygrophoropsis aurantiaca]|uniref:Uncharacterized protein n=1 Tax=Hygrophoropsis aurantiaca TaxID=72124 RepID=A0ACB8AP71_9AGAM|nr:hypothetical protein BJ138DRAFT_1078212 [Hygrophoropsis aurantiaca]
MGVHGLTTYLRENKRVLSKTIELSARTKTITAVVVDGWSFIYELYDQSKLSWIYGGEYKAFYESVQRVVRAWIDVGLQVYFVFDGAVPELKIPTLISRLNESNIKHSLLFFRTSALSRSTPRFIHETRMMPPLVQDACFHALETIASTTKMLQLHFADEEGDPYAVELAGRLGAYVIGNDSDFVILNSGHYAGYISLDEMLWTTSVTEESILEDQDSGFQTVSKTKLKKKSITEHRSGRGLVPPDAGSDLTLSVLIYTPSILASHFKIPVTLLPLLGALVGNDYSNNSSVQRNMRSLFFERHLTPSQRISHVATTLNAILSASTQKRKARHQVGSVMDLIDRTVRALLIRSVSTMASGEVEGIIDRIVNATLQYAIDKYEGDIYGPEGLWPTKICALHGSEVCRLPVLFSRTLDSLPPDDTEGVVPLQCEQIRILYVHAYRSGRFQPKLMDILSTGTFWPRLFLENPDFENVARSIGRPVRQWTYAFLEDAVGLPEAPEEEKEEETIATPVLVEEEDEDELIDVVEEDSDNDRDLLAPLRGELQKLRGSEDDELEDLSTSTRPRVYTVRPKCVIEYVRRGTRVAPEEVIVPDIGTLLSSSAFSGFDPEHWIPIQLRSVDERFTMLLHALKSDLPSVRALPSEQIIAALVLRWVVQILHLRAIESGNGRDRQKERWTQHEARAFLAAFMSGFAKQTPDSQDVNQELPATERNIQLMAQVLMAFEVILHLSQVLLLSDQIPANIHHLSGRTFHFFSTSSGSLGPDAVPGDLWNACQDGLESAFGEERKKRSKNEQMARRTGRTLSPRGRSPINAASKGGLFGMLMDMDA